MQCRLLYITLHACFVCVHVMAANYLCIDDTKVLTRRFVKSTSSIGCVGAETNVPVDSNAGEPTRPCTSGIGYFSAEGRTFVQVQHW